MEQRSEDACATIQVKMWIDTMSPLHYEYIFPEKLRNFTDIGRTSQRAHRRTKDGKLCLNALSNVQYEDAIRDVSISPTHRRSINGRRLLLVVKI